MWIKFGNDEYFVLSVEYEVDEDDIPVDIVIYGDEDILYKIAERHGIIGFNCQECDWLHSAHKGFSESTFEALYGRLHPFTISKCKKVKYT